MKKLTFILLCLLFLPVYIKAEKNPIEQQIIYGNCDLSLERNRNVGVIEAFYDTETGTIEVNGDAATDAEVYLYDSYGKIVNYSPSINSSLSVAAHGTYTLYISGDGWYAEGTVRI